MLYSTGKSVYSIFYSTLYMYATVILHFSGTPFRESDDPHTFVDLLVSTSTYVFSCLSYIISQHIYFFYYGNHINNAVSADLLIMQYVAASVICLLSSVWYWRIWNITFTTGKQVGYICLHMQIMRGFLLVCMHIFLLDFFFLQIRCKILLFVSFYKLYK